MADGGMKTVAKKKKPTSAVTAYKDFNAEASFFIPRKPLKRNSAPALLLIFDSLMSNWPARLNA